MQSSIDINIVINVLFRYMNENPPKNDPLKDPLENNQPINTNNNPEAVAEFKRTMFVSEDGKSNLENPIVSVEEKAEKQKQNDTKIDNTIQQLNNVYDKVVVSEATHEMEVPKPPIINKPESIKDFKETMIVSEDGKPIEKKLSKEELTSLLKQNSIHFGHNERNAFNWLQDEDKGRFFVPKMTWNENSGVLIFSDENGDTWASPMSDEKRQSLFKSRDYIKDESIGVPPLNTRDPWPNQEGFEKWKNQK